MALRRTLGHSGFRRLWFGQLASRIGDSVHEIALVWVVYEVTGDATLLSLTFVASFLPTVALSLPAGALVDRVNRKYVLVVSDVVRAAAVLVIPFVGRGPLLVPTVLSVAFLTGVADAFDGPARSAFVPRLVPESDLDGANSLVRMTSTLSQVLFAAGGVVVAVFGSFAAFYVDAATFVVSALFVASIPSEHGVPDREDAEAAAAAGAGMLRSAAAEMVADVRTVLGFVRDRPLLRNLLVLGAVLQFAVAPVNVAVPVYAPTLPVPGSLALGLVYSAFFSGMTLGTIAIGRFDGFVDAVRGVLVVAGIVGFGVGLLAAVLPVPTTYVGVAGVLALFAFAGFGFAAATVPRQTLAHLLVPDSRLGRYMAVATTLSHGAFVVGLGVTGPLVDRVGARVTLLGVGVVVASIGVVFAFQPVASAHEAASTVDGTAGSPEASTGTE